MRTIVAISAASIAIAMASPAVAQQSDASVNSYLCQFAGKCDGDTAATPTKAAPATKGFRLAAPQTADTTATKAAPATKGFRLGAPQAAATSPTQAAPATKGFRLAQAQAATPTQAAPKETKGFRVAKSATPVAAPAHLSRASRTQVAAVRPVVAAPATNHVNLMLNFEYNSDAMTPAAEAKAKVFAQALMTPELKDKHFLIEGHTDARGSRDLNVDLSRRRAQSVANYLIAQGVDSHAVEVKGVGPDEPLPGHSATSEANRRVEAVLL